MKTESESMEEDGFDAPRSNFEAQRELSKACAFLFFGSIALVIVAFAAVLAWT